MQSKNGFKTPETPPADQDSQESRPTNSRAYRTKKEIGEFEEQLNFENPDFAFIPSGSCQFIQQGPYLVCQSCILQHAVWIGMDKIMVGVDDDGKPILKNKIEVLSKQA